jgi:ribose-phosphate pyrophosphokinase
VAVTLPDTVTCAGRTVVIVDDVISSGHTISAVAAAAIAAGAVRIMVCATHALYDTAAAEVMVAAGVERIASSGSIPHTSNRFSILDTLASSLKESHDD